MTSKNTGKSPAVDGGERRDADRRLRQAVRFARILKLLELLQGRDRHDTVSLATGLEVSRRTVLRDIDVLRLAGVGLDYDTSKKGYVLHGDYRFAVAGLTDDELLGQATAAAPTSARGLDVGEGAVPTARKIRATGKGQFARTLLEDALRVTSVLDLKLAEHDVDTGRRSGRSSLPWSGSTPWRGHTPARINPARRRSCCTRSGSVWSSRRGI